MSFEKADISKELEKKKTQIRRGVLELCILSIIAQEEVYPSDIIKKLKESELIVVEGTLYPLLTRLKNAGLLHYTWRESNAGPPRKYYHITESGRVFLEGLLDTWNQFVLAVEQSTKAITKSKRTK
ncbi:MAG: PadR family transcriptional regulator [Bacteroidetes bacterium]|nr:MAG: PadR family transcriptional regulator [Bacteroidota bacterium]